ncbi:SusC/RagA family TonB-linked outer membrane protein [Chitinophaga horti]|uniref:SusC/RagA family TonB-linked outer membrane protein n=1 Tax=Chitinophaga horti TaxID=2920382 RepID=A0ABY6J7K8_9BACT|nr:SusC/RagA family TonB-linked outer membrane protein [Chitinophaga horti]UYQ94134.1 SusC/RagA family TonB-linked outer membrane protein [Chitinophaga horti]
MKLTILLLTVAFMGVSAKGVSQAVTLSGKNIRLEKAFETIRTQTGYHVFCDLQLLKDAQLVNVSATSMPLNQFLDLIFKDQSLDFIVREQTIFVSKKVNVPYVAPAPAAVPVQGIVTDGHNPLFGATIKVKGTSRSIINKEDGRFDITVNIGDVLVISYVGFKSQEVKIANSTDLTIVLQRESIEIDAVDIKVSTGYQTISKERATGSYSVVTAKELEKVPTPDLLESLEGKVPGVRFDVKSGIIQIRTTNTYAAAGSEPLIVIDGFPQIPSGDRQRLTTRSNSVMSNNAILSSFNPRDIEQITFLKDAVATSIWGARGANGVIVIETKKGKRGTSPSINVSATLGVSKPPAMKDLDWMSTAEYVDLELEMLQKGFLIDAKSQPGYQWSMLQTPNPSDVQEWYYKAKRGEVTQAAADAAIAAIAQRSNYGQIEKYLLRNAVSQQYNLSVSGAGDNSSYYISGGYTNDAPIYRANKSTNTFVTANFTNDFYKKYVKLRTGFAYQASKSITNLSATNALSQFGTGLRPYDMLVDESGDRIRRSITMREEVNDSLVRRGYLPFTYNAIDELQYSSGTATGQQIRLTAGLAIKLTNWANIDVSGMYQRVNTNNKYIDEVNSYAGRVLLNTYTTLHPTTGKPVYNLPYGGRYALNDGTAYDYNFRGVLNINHSFSTDHQLNAIAGAEIRETYNKNYGTTRYGYDADANSFATINPTAQLPTMFGWSQQLGDNVGGVGEQKNRYLSYFGNAAYTYKNRYNVSASVRFDDYTLLGLERSKRAKPFWSAGAKWSLAQEAFLQGAAWMDALDVRVTYGTGGAVPLLGNNVTIIQLNTTDPSTQLPTGTIAFPANQELGWELTKTLNFGADLRLLQNRLSITADAYMKNSEGIMVSLPFNPTYGWGTMTFNTATLKSHGVEFSISGRPLNEKNWSIQSTFNLGYGRTKVTDSRYKNTVANNVLSGVPVEGYQLGSAFVYRSAGLDDKGQTQIYDRDNKIINNTTNLTSAFTIKDLKYAGLRVAPYHGGFFNNFRYKNFDLGVQMTYYMGHIFMKPAITNYPNFAGQYYGSLGRQQALAERWREPGDEANTTVPGLSNVNFNSINRYANSDNLVRNANNIRLQQISLAYSVPQHLLPRGVFKSLTASANARNLGLIWRANKDGIDPEYVNTNGNYYSMPPVTSFLFNINATF